MSLFETFIISKPKRKLGSKLEKIMFRLPKITEKGTDSTKEGLAKERVWSHPEGVTRNEMVFGL